MTLSLGYLVGMVAGSVVAALGVEMMVSPSLLTRNSWAVLLLVAAGGIIGMVLARLLVWRRRDNVRRGEDGGI